MFLFKYLFVWYKKNQNTGKGESQELYILVCMLVWKVQIRVSLFWNSQRWTSELSNLQGCSSRQNDVRNETLLSFFLPVGQSDQHKGKGDSSAVWSFALKCWKEEATPYSFLPPPQHLTMARLFLLPQANDNSSVMHSSLYSCRVLYYKRKQWVSGLDTKRKCPSMTISRDW